MQGPLHRGRLSSHCISGPGGRRSCSAAGRGGSAAGTQAVDPEPRKLRWPGHRRAVGGRTVLLHDRYAVLPASNCSLPRLGAYVGRPSPRPGHSGSTSPRPLSIPNLRSRGRVMPHLPWRVGTSVLAAVLIASAGAADAATTSARYGVQGGNAAPSLQRQVGSGWTVVSMPWPAVEPTPGHFDFSKFDSQVSGGRRTDRVPGADVRGDRDRQRLLGNPCPAIGCQGAGQWPVYPGGAT